MLHELFLILFALAGGWLSRMCGGAPPKLPFGLDQWIYSLPYLIVSLPLSASLAAFMSVRKEWRPYIKTVVLLPYLAAVTGKRTGHGGFMDLGTWTKERTDEALEWIIKPLHGKINEYWYDFAGLVIVGLAVSILPAISVMICGQWLAGLILIAGGALKAVAYAIGWKFEDQIRAHGPKHLDEPTAIGEFLTGVFGYSSIGLVLMITFS